MDPQSAFKTGHGLLDLPRAGTEPEYGPVPAGEGSLAWHAREKVVGTTP